MTEGNPNMDLYKRLIIRFILAFSFIGLSILLIPIIFKLLHPFIFALFIAVILNPMVSKIHMLTSKLNKGSSSSRKVITLILNLLLLLIVFSLISYLSYLIIRELISFSLSIQQNWGNIVFKFNNLQENLTWITKRLSPEVLEFIDGFSDSLLEFIKNTSKMLLSSSLSATASVISRAGSFFINVLTFFLAMYFLISDFHILGSIADKHLNKSFINTMDIIKVSLKNALGGFFKAQFILASFAFVFMFIALKIYGQPHGFIIALFLGLIDLLPIIGTIAVLLPWGVIEYISGDIKKGVFLIIVGLVFLLIRKIIEPKIMGSQTGLHPLLALISTYVGLKFSGLWGAVLGPLILMIILSFIQSGIFDNTVKDLRDLYIRISAILGRKDEI